MVLDLCKRCYNVSREEVQSEDFLETVKAGQGLRVLEAGGKGQGHLG